MHRFEGDEPFVRIVALVVDPGVRERGVGRMLMDEAEGRPPRGRAVRRGDVGPPSALRPPPLRVVGYDGTSRPTFGSASDGRDPAGDPRSGPRTEAFPYLRLIGRAGALLDLPWELPLAGWEAAGVTFRALPVGPSRHLVRFLERDGRMYALKELPLRVAGSEYEVLRVLAQRGLPAVVAVGIPKRSVREPACSSPSTSRIRSNTGAC